MNYSKQYLLGKEYSHYKYIGELEFLKPYVKIKDKENYEHLIGLEESYKLAIENCITFVVCGAGFSVFRFDDAPPFLQKFCCFNGGDEDWLVICHKNTLDKEYGLLRWIEVMDSCDDPDEYEIGDYLVFVGSHS